MKVPSALTRLLEGRSAGKAAATVASGALVGWLVGALPWVLEGPRLSISSGWPSVTTDQVTVLVPFGEYRLVALGTVGIVGGVAAVGWARLLRMPLWLGALGGGAGVLLLWCAPGSPVPVWASRWCAWAGALPAPWPVGCSPPARSG